MRKARFKIRSLIRGANNNNKSINTFLKQTSSKKNILNYSQLRIALLHFLSVAIPRKSVVATTSYTIFDMVNIIINAGHIPRLVDIDLKNLGPSIDELIDLVENKIVDVVIFTHLHGYHVDLKRLSEICEKNNCILIEDCAQSLWCRDWSNIDNLPGSYGDIALFSSGMFKSINTISGGFLTFEKNASFSNELIDSYLSLSDNFTKDFVGRSLYCFSFYFLTSDIIFNFFLFPILRFSKLNKIDFINRRAREENYPKYIERSKKDILRMNPIQRFFCLFQGSDYLDRDYKKRKEYFKIYINKLYPLIYDNKITIPGFDKNINLFTMFKRTSFNQIPVLTEKRDDLILYLVYIGIDIAPQHIRDLSATFPYSNYALTPCKNSSYVEKRIFLLPCYPDYSKQNVLLLCKGIIKFFKEIE